MKTESSITFFDRTQKPYGFTLIEVMVAIVIMSFLTILVSTSIRTAVQNKIKLEARVKSETSLFDALRVIKMDVERAFHYQDVFFEIENLAIMQLEQEKQQGGKGAGGGAGGQRGQGNQRQPPIQLTQFLGEGGSMHFTALNHYRTKYNAPESDQMEVGYVVEGCQKKDGSGGSQCLWRRTSTQIDDEVDKDGPRVKVVEDVSNFRLSYRSNKESDDWVDQWRSDNKGRADHRNRFPHFVKIELAIGDKDDPKSRPVSQIIVVSVAFPNNEPHITQQAVGDQGQPPGGQPQ